jgi:hypothetical protein
MNATSFDMKLEWNDYQTLKWCMILGKNALVQVDIQYIVMVSYVDKHRRKFVFQIGDLVKYKVSPMQSI